MGGMLLFSLASVLFQLDLCHTAVGHTRPSSSLCCLHRRFSSSRSVTSRWGTVAVGAANSQNRWISGIIGWIGELLWSSVKRTTCCVLVWLKKEGDIRVHVFLTSLSRTFGRWMRSECGSLHLQAGPHGPCLSKMSRPGFSVSEHSTNCSDFTGASTEARLWGFVT